MRRIWLFILVLSAVSCLIGSPAWAAPSQIPENATWMNVLVRGDSYDGETVGNMEGLTGDNNGVFYVADRGDPVNNENDACHVWRIDTNTDPAAVDLVGQIIATCRPSGLTFDANGDLFITSSDVIYKLTPNALDPTSDNSTGEVYATGVPGANGVAFDKGVNPILS